MKYLLYILLFSVIKRAHAATFSLETMPITNESGGMEIKVKTEDLTIFNKRFRFKPNSENLIISAWNPLLNKWVTSTDLWVLQPILETEIKLKINSPNFIAENITFIFQKVTTGELYETNQIKIWDGIWYRKYLEALNKNIKEL